MGMRDVLEAAEKVEPIAEKNGVKFMSFQDQNVVMQADMIEKKVDSGVRTMNRDGTVARSYTRYAGINPDSLFINRYREIEEDGKKKLQVIIDWRACDEQSTGKCYLQTVPAYVISRGQHNKLGVEKVVPILKDDFLREFTHRLDVDAMSQILPLIEGSTTNISTDKLSI